MMLFAKTLFQRRIIAFLVDCVVFYLIIFVPMLMGLMLSIGFTGSAVPINNREIVSGLGAGLAVILPFFLFYKSCFEYVLAQTPGKRVMGVEVSGIRSFSGAILRNLPFLFPIISLIDLAPMIFSEQRLFDRLSNTQVLNLKGVNEE